MKKFVMGALAIEYSFLVLCSTVICRAASVSKRVELKPFYNYVDIWNGVDFKRTLMEVLLNVALFVPIGFLLGGMMPKGFLKVLLTGFLLSSLIELLQLASGRGVCETNDVIHNTVGCMLGYAAAMAMKKRFASE
ncbi:MAG: VanZ family protein [Bacteroidales bacterium]|nr:VanZ family protein [Bacteroidales bacterium]